ncbi:hypothetical protein T4E_7936 [Trichinella pseudospiralis]|uniref:Uncharacterized protein n=1 Tax=Trichinella pseudospiralis TaxID=6337 RepID=A0A0V0W112_TRIPS|nr:hypothetical protein T4E_7936 [Trichinella pseudospiralis]
MFSKVPWYCPVLLSGSAPNGAIQRRDHLFQFCR